MVQNKPVETRWSMPHCQIGVDVKPATINQAVCMNPGIFGKQLDKIVVYHYINIILIQSLMISTSGSTSVKPSPDSSRFHW